MGDLRVGLVLNEGRSGVPLDRLAKIADEAELFLRLLARDAGIEIRKGGWLAQNFRNGSLSFEAVHAADYDRPQVMGFTRAFEYATAFNPETQRLNGIVSAETMRQYARIADPLDLDDKVKLGVFRLPDDEAATETTPAPELDVAWAYLAKPAALRLAHRLDEVVAYYGTVTGVIQALFKTDDMHFRLRDHLTGQLINCYFKQERYSDVIKALEARDAIVYVNGEIRARRVDRRIESSRVSRLMIAPVLGADDYRRFFGSAPDLGGEVSSAALIGAVRDADG